MQETRIPIVSGDIKEKRKFCRPSHSLYPQAIVFAPNRAHVSCLVCQLISDIRDCRTLALYVCANANTQQTYGSKRYSINRYPDFPWLHARRPPPCQIPILRIRYTNALIYMQPDWRRKEKEGNGKRSWSQSVRDRNNISHETRRTSLEKVKRKGSERKFRQLEGGAK